VARRRRRDRRRVRGGHGPLLRCHPGPGALRARHDEARFKARLQAEAKQVASTRDQYFAARFGAGARELEATAEALEEVARIEFEGGSLKGARTQLEAVLAKAPHSASAHNNLGVVLAGMDSFTVADENWQAALALGSRDPGIGLNRGIACWARGDSAGALSLLGPAVARAGGYAAACKLIGLDPDSSRDRAADFSREELTLRSRIRNVLRQSEVAGVEKGRVPTPPASPPGIPNVPSSELPRYLYWIE
jgi:predicted Zn-dependent protease